MLQPTWSERRVEAFALNHRIPIEGLRTPLSKPRPHP
jgi:hypothetical protein